MVALLLETLLDRACKELNFRITLALTNGIPNI